MLSLYVFYQSLNLSRTAEVGLGRELAFLDKELQQVVQDAELGRRYADKLVKVWTCDGGETWVLIHVEVQGDAEAAFAERMYVYHYRLFDRYKTDIVSLGVLVDATAAFRPSAYRWARWGCEVAFHFPAVKLLDWRTRWAELEASDNHFALVIMAQLTAKARARGYRTPLRLVTIACLIAGTFSHLTDFPFDTRYCARDASSREFVIAACPHET